jgi:hypothetical protein
MDHFRSTAFFLTVWQTFLTTLVAVLLIVLQDPEAATALLIAANLALMFALTLMACAGRLTDQRIIRSQLWRSVPAQRRPPGEVGLRMARAVLEETWLRFAKGAAAVAIVLCALAYASHDVTPAAWAQAARERGDIQRTTGNLVDATYRTARRLPMN